MQIWVRTEASARIGLGHFMRCFAIAEAARHSGFPVTFLLNDTADAIKSRLAQIGAGCLRLDTPIGSPEDAAALRAIVPRGEVILLDSYALGADFYADLYTDYRLAVMDDLAEVRPLQVHLVINAAVSASADLYAAITPGARLCLGPEYAAIRQEFRRFYPLPRRAHICVLFGGSDPKGFTAVCAEALLEAAPMHDIRLIVGPANRDVDALRTLCATHPALKLYLSPDNVAEVLSGASLVVTAAGGSVGEIAAMRLPALVMVVVDNQAASLTASPYPVMDARSGWPEGFNAEVEALLGDPRARLNAAADAHTLVDGRGAERIVEAMTRV
ncbi:MAG: UDP-2,4-diacetamido-2,4,6-trideoxy-beta-L-altropyranose hydrolase [Asticcacaulis sp.]